MGNDQSELVTSRRRLWGTILCFLAQNVSIALAFGSFGPLLSSTESHFEISRSVAALGMSAMTIAIGIGAPFIGDIFQRLQMGQVMAAGAMLSCLGYFGLSVTNSYVVAIPMYGLVGLGFCILSVIGPVTFVSRWYHINQGRILGLVNLPLLFVVAPFAIGEILRMGSREQLLQLFAIALLPLAALLWFLPEKGGGASAATTSRSGGSEGIVEGGDALRFNQLIRLRPFWLLSIGIGIMAGAATGFLTHIVPFGISKSLTLQEAGGLLSAYTAAGVLGPMFFGWLADRIGPTPTLILTAVVQAVLWISLVYLSGPALYFLAAIMGFCLTPLITLHGTAIGDTFGSERISRVMGASYSIKLPFLLATPPLLGYAFESQGDYGIGFLLMGVVMAVPALLFLKFVRDAGRIDGRVTPTMGLRG